MQLHIPNYEKSKQSQNVIRRREAPEHTIHTILHHIYIYIYIYINPLNYLPYKTTTQHNTAHHFLFCLFFNYHSSMNSIDYSYPQKFVPTTVNLDLHINIPKDTTTFEIIQQPIYKQFTNKTFQDPLNDI